MNTTLHLWQMVLIAIVTVLVLTIIDVVRDRRRK